VFFNILDVDVALKEGCRQESLDLGGMAANAPFVTYAHPSYMKVVRYAP